MSIARSAQRELYIFASGNIYFIPGLDNIDFFLIALFNSGFYKRQQNSQNFFQILPIKNIKMMEVSTGLTAKRPVVIFV